MINIDLKALALEHKRKNAKNYLKELYQQSPLSLEEIKNLASAKSVNYHIMSKEFIESIGLANKIEGSISSYNINPINGKHVEAIVLTCPNSGDRLESTRIHKYYLMLQYICSLDVVFSSHIDYALSTLKVRRITGKALCKLGFLELANKNAKNGFIPLLKNPSPIHARQVLEAVQGEYKVYSGKKNTNKTIEVIETTINTVQKKEVTPKKVSWWKKFINLFKK